MSPFEALSNLLTEHRKAREQIAVLTNGISALQRVEKPLRDECAALRDRTKAAENYIEDLRGAIERKEMVISQQADRIDKLKEQLALSRAEQVNA